MSKSKMRALSFFLPCLLGIIKIPVAQAQGAGHNIQVPGGDTVYHAAHFSQEWQNSFDNGLQLRSQIDRFGSPSVSGKKVSVVTWFASAFENGRPKTWGESQRSALDKVQKSGAMSLIKFSTIDPNFRAFPMIMQASSIARGEQDVYFQNMAGVIKRAGVPVFISINHEMNGTWYPYSQAYDANILGPAPPTTAADFKAAWRRIVAVFNSVGAQNAIWVWSPNAEDVGPTPAATVHFTDYYPGDDVVDWVGVSLYSDNPPSSLDALNRFAQLHGKPIFITEWATSKIKNDNYTKYRGRPFPGETTWVADFFRSLETRYTNVKGLSWFETNKISEDNFLLERVPAQAQSYEAAVSKPRYLGSLGGANPQPTLDVPRREEVPREALRVEVPRVQAPPVETVRNEVVAVENPAAAPRRRFNLKVVATQ